MKELWNKHWGKFISIFFSVLVAGLIGFCGARIDLIDRISAIKTTLQREIRDTENSLENKLGEMQKTLSSNFEDMRNNLVATNSKVVEIGVTIEIWGSDRPIDRANLLELIKRQGELATAVQGLIKEVEDMKTSSSRDIRATALRDH